MTSEISILRKYLNIVNLKKRRKAYTFKIGIYNDSHIYQWGDFCLETECDSYIDIFQDEGFTITDCNGEFILNVADIPEFLETDDIYLVLRYGRKITDNNIIQSLNKQLDYMGCILKLDDFDEFLNLRI